MTSQPESRLGFLTEICHTIHWMLQDCSVSQELRAVLRSAMEAENEAARHRASLGLLAPLPAPFLGSQLEVDFPLVMFDRHSDLEASIIVLGAVNDLAARQPELSECDLAPVGPDAESLAPYWDRYVRAAQELRHWHLPRIKMLLSTAEEGLRFWSNVYAVDVDDSGTDLEYEPSAPSAIIHRSTIDALENQTQKLDRESGLWVRNKRAAAIEGLEVATLRDYRKLGDSTRDKSFGRDKDGRIWRRQGTDKSHPWYLRSTLKAAK